MKSNRNCSGARRKLLAVFSRSPSERPALAGHRVGRRRIGRPISPVNHPSTSAARRPLSCGRHWLAPAAVSHDREADAQICMEQRPRQPPVSGSPLAFGKRRSEAHSPFAHVTVPKPRGRRVIADVEGSATAFARRLMNRIWRVPPRIQEPQHSRQALHSAPAATELMWACAKRLQEARASCWPPFQAPRSARSQMGFHGSAPRDPDANHSGPQHAFPLRASTLAIMSDAGQLFSSIARSRELLSRIASAVGVSPHAFLSGEAHGIESSEACELLQLWYGLEDRRDRQKLLKFARALSSHENTL